MQGLCECVDLVTPDIEEMSHTELHQLGVYDPEHQDRCFEELRRRGEAINIAFLLRNGVPRGIICKFFPFEYLTFKF